MSVARRADGRWLVKFKQHGKWVQKTFRDEATATSLDEAMNAPTIDSRPSVKEYVFCHCNGEPYTNRIRLTRRLCVKAEVDHFCLHAIRHLTATLLAKEGVPMKDIQAILRHKRLATTENYIARMMPRENVLEGVLVKRERPETLQRFEPEKSEVPHGGPQFETPSVKLQ